MISVTDSIVKKERRLVKKENPSPMKRSDGMETRNHIIECAGRLFAQNGYAKTTSKSICNLAQVNLAAVNYHFGSRAGLYLTVLEEIQNRITELDSLTQIKNSPASPSEKMEAFLDFFIASAFRENNWPIQLWTREIMEPSPFLPQIISQKILPKFSVVANLFSDYLQYSPEDPKLYAAILSVMAPFSVACLGQNHPLAMQAPVKFPKQHLLKLLRANALCTLRALRNENSPDQPLNR